MKDGGFNNQIGVCKDTGFVFGGNAENCGTWMDKMGSSEKAGNKGVPATPRVIYHFRETSIYVALLVILMFFSLFKNGVAIEILGLSYSCLVQLSQSYAKGHFPYNSVQDLGNGELRWTFQKWAQTIKASFEDKFHIDGQDHYNRGIYKDCLGSSPGYTDEQLRYELGVQSVFETE